MKYIFFIGCLPTILISMDYLRVPYSDFLCKSSQQAPIAVNQKPFIQYRFTSSGERFAKVIDDEGKISFARDSHYKKSYNALTPLAESALYTFLQYAWQEVHCAHQNQCILVTCNNIIIKKHSVTIKVCNDEVEGIFKYLADE